MRDITLGDTLYMMFTTRRFSTGAPFVLAGTPVVSAYENESLTQITAGITLGVDHDGVAGLNLMTVVASSGNGFEVGKDYNLVITTGTVDSVSVVGEVVGQFSIQRSAAAVDLANGTDGLGVLKTEVDGIQADTEDIQSRLPAALVNSRMDCTIDGTGMEAGAVTAVQSGLATSAALVTVDTVVDAIKVTTDKLDDTLEDDAGTYRFTANALEEGPTSEGGSGATAQEVWEYATRVLTAGTNIDLSALATAASVADLPTNAELTAALGTADDAVLAAIATLNDFDPATEEVLANVKKVNDVELTGDGTATPWGPA